MRLNFDSETCGLVGPPVLFQYSIDDGPIVLYEIWNEPVHKTLNLIEIFCTTEICGFNVAFDWFHIVQLYNTFREVSEFSKKPNIDEVAYIFTRQPRNYCLKPKNVLDLMLHLKKTNWQTLMDRDDICIKRIPLHLAQPLATTLEQKLVLPNIYFHKRSEGYKWIVEPCEDDFQFSNVKLKWGASYGLKPLCAEIFKVNTLEFPIPRDLWPNEANYNPYGIDWSHTIYKHIAYWQHNKTARSYAEQDIILLKRLYHHFGEPEFGDVDSLLTIAVANARWIGFNLDFNAIKDRYDQQTELVSECPINFNSHHDVKRYLNEKATDIERTLIPNTTKKTLDALATLTTEVGHRARLVRQARKADKEIDILTKLITTRRFCPDLKVIGTRSGRMAGGSDEGSVEGSLNPQGIQRSVEFRKLFLLADKDEILSGGDFDSFEVVIADAVYNDEKLREDLRSGKKFHGLFGQILYDEDYNDVVKDKAKYSAAKTGAFGLLYGAQEHKLAEATNISVEHARQVLEDFFDKYKKVGAARKLVAQAFCSMTQPNGVGTEVIWKEPADYIESLLGYRRYFTLENNIVKCLYDLAVNPPDVFNVAGECVRTTRKQTLKGAVQSALFSCAFQLQAANMRAAANHVIQSTGAEETKRVQEKIWRKQPVGIHKCVVRLLNVHDEIMCVHHLDLTREIRWVVEDEVERFKSVVPLVKMDWQCNLQSWGEK